MTNEKFIKVLEFLKATVSDVTIECVEDILGGDIHHAIASMQSKKDKPMSRHWPLLTQEEDEDYVTTQINTQKNKVIRLEAMLCALLGVIEEIENGTSIEGIVSRAEERGDCPSIQDWWDEYKEQDIERITEKMQTLISINFSAQEKEVLKKQIKQVKIT